jgi:hypothetical protein
MIDGVVRNAVSIFRGVAFHDGHARIVVDAKVNPDDSSMSVLLKGVCRPDAGYLKEVADSLRRFQIE